MTNRMLVRQRELRLRCLDVLNQWGAGHVGRALSAIDLLEALYFGQESGRSIFRYDPALPQWSERDVFVLSEVEVLAALYVVLEEAGYRLPGSLPLLMDRKVPGVEMSMDRSGCGLAYAVGVANALKMEKSRSRVFCLVGEHELLRGQAWEAVMLAAERRLDNLIVVVNDSALRDRGLSEPFEAFGYKVARVLNGHDHDDLVHAYVRARLTQRKPACVIARTKKCSGVPFAEAKSEYDNVIFSDREYKEARAILL